MSKTNQYAVLCGTYPNGAVVDGVRYCMELTDKPTNIDCRRRMLLSLVNTIEKCSC